MKINILYILILIFTLISIIFTSGCNINKDDEDIFENKEDIFENIDKQIVDQMDNSDNCTECFANSQYEIREAGKIETIIEYSDYFAICVNYPRFKKEILDSITESYIFKYIDEFKDQVNGNTYENSNYKDELNIDYETWAFSDDIASIKYSILINMPYYAHPYTKIDTAVYDFNNQKEIYLDDIMQGNYLNRISELIIENLKSNDKYSDYIDSNQFEMGTKPINENYSNFILKKDKIVFYFEKYQIFAGFLGEPEVEILYEDLEGFIKPLDFSNNDNSVVPKENKEDKTNREIDPEKPMVALTFDDGPYDKSTKSILDTLKENNGVATFFILGNRVSSNQLLLKRMIDEGNEIGNHSYNHKQLTTLSDEELHHQIEKTQNIIKEIVGVTPKFMRPTYGSHNERLREMVGLPLILWSVDTRDWDSRDAKMISDHVFQTVKDGSVVLMHDIYNSTADAVKIIVPELVRQGYQLVTISELYEYKGRTLEAGFVYRDIK